MIFNFKAIQRTPTRGIIAEGIADLYLYNDEKEPCQWYAVRGEIEDWSIYFDKVGTPQQRVIERGLKLRRDERILELTKCTKGALKAYRY